MNANVFPISMNKHIIFCAVAAVFFVLQFIRTKRVYQLILAVAFGGSLLIYLNTESSLLFYGVGIGEAVLLIAALVANIVQNRHARKANGDDSGPSDGGEAAAQPAEGGGE